MPLQNQFTEAQAVVNSDTVDIFSDGRAAEALYVGAAGNITVVMLSDKAKAGPVTVLFTAVPVGTILPIRCTRVMATGTAASALVALR